jgi:uncharacterized membrane protein (UPF0127 family)
MRSRRLLGIVVVAVLGFEQLDPSPALSETAIGAGLPVDCVSVGEACLLVEVARTSPHRALGLRGRPTLEPFDGMLFEYTADTSTTFTMAGTFVPLTIGFYDATGAPVGRTDMEPCLGSDLSCPHYGSPRPYRFALEVEQGRLPDGRLTRCDSRYRP